MMMKIIYDQSGEMNRKPKWSYISNHRYRCLIIVSRESGKNNALLNLKKHQQPDTDKIYLYVRDPFESKYHLLINKEKM